MSIRGVWYLQLAVYGSHLGREQSEPLLRLPNLMHKPISEIERGVVHVHSFETSNGTEHANCFPILTDGLDFFPGCVL